jgi:hypothetical protein
MSDKMSNKKVIPLLSKRVRKGVTDSFGDWSIELLSYI